MAGLSAGSDAIDFKARNLTGEIVRLSDFKGKPIILKLATTWCPTCKEQSREFIKAGDYLKDNDVVVVEVFIQEKASRIEKYLSKYDYPMTFVPLIDEGEISGKYGVYMIPRVLLIDRDFKIRRDGNIMKKSDLIEKLGPLVQGGS